MDAEYEVWLAKESRWAEILGDTQAHRAKEFIELFGEQIARYRTPGEALLRSEIFAARARAADIWRYDRETSDGRWIRELVDGNPSLIDGRERQFATLQHQYRGRNLILQAMEQHDQFVESTRDAIDGKVIPMPARKVG